MTNIYLYRHCVGRHGRYCDIIASRVSSDNSRWASNYADGQWYNHVRGRVIGRSNDSAYATGKNLCTMSSIFLSIAVLIAVVYAALARLKSGKALVSVSSISYILPSWMFTTFFGVEMLLLYPVLFEKLLEVWKFLGFICMLGLWAVAASPYFRTEATTLHNIGGFGFCIVAQIIVGIINPILLFGWMPVVVYILSGLLKKKKRSDITFWAEATAYIILIISLWE